VTSVETLTTTTDSQLTLLTLGAKAAAAGVVTVNLNDTTAVDSVVVGSGFTNNLTVDLDLGANANSVVATGYTGVLTVTAADTDLNTSASVLTGGSGSDILSITASGGSVLTGDLANVTKIENFNIVGTTAAVSIALNDANAVGTGVSTDETITVNASALTTGVATIDASAENDAKVVITGGAGNDIITGSTSVNWGDTITAGAGNDTIKFANGILTATDVVNGGTDTNTIEFTTDATVLDAAFTGVTNVQVLTSTANINQTLTLGALAMAAGVTTVNLADTTGDDSVTVLAGFTSNLTVDLDTDATNANTVNATAYTGSLTVTATDTELDSRAAAITGGTGSDTLAITAAGGTIEAADLATVTKVETFQILGTTAATTISLSDNNATYTNAATYETITVNASALTTGVATINASAEDDAKVVIIGGASNDIITASTSINLGDNITAGDGNDTINISADGVLTYIDTISGGNGNDILSISANSTIADVDFTNVSSIKTLTAAANIEFTSLTLGSLAMAAGVDTVTFAGNATSNLVVGAGFTSALNVGLTAGVFSDKVDASASASALAISSAAAVFAAGDTIKGGTSTGDTITLTADNGTATTTLMTGIETITIAYAANSDVTVTMGANDLQIASGKTLTVNAAAMTETDEVFTFNGNAAETDGYLSITGSSGDDVITGAGAADTISGGTGADVITGGVGADSLTGGGGADIFVYSAVAQSNGTAVDTITDFVSATDKLRVTLDYSSLTSSQTVNATILTAVTSLSDAQSSLSGERGQYVYDTTNSKLYINFNADNLITSLDYSVGITAASTPANTIADGDLNFSILGGTAADVITAGGGADTINGGTGADVITGGAGLDSLTGGTGIDTFVLTGKTASTLDTISDWTNADDLIQVSIATHDSGGVLAAIGAGGDIAGEFTSFANAAALTGASVAASTDAALFIHLADTGAVYYNADGATAGGFVQILAIGAASTLADGNFVIVA
jgi:Ca2+-binding RTX toxin-like protein